MLSGTGSDGTAGLQAIKAAGGITFAQDPDTASYPAMPQNAVGGGAVDFVLPLEQIGAALSRLSRAPSVRPSPAGPPARARGPKHPDDALPEILQLLQAATGVDFSDYKEATLQRRVQRRMLLARATSPAAYLRRLRGDPAELEALFQDFLIKVTSFFRDPELFQALERDHFAKLLRQHPRDLPVRVWVPGCATGEEVYSLAMALMDVMAHQRQSKTLQLFGTDLSDDAIQRARAGRYPASTAATVPAGHLQRHFVAVPGGYQISKAVRDACVFARHNLLEDPPFFRLDVVSCRNVLTYLKPELQEQLAPLYHYALNPGGLLILGTSENIPGSAEFFRIADKKQKIFLRKETPHRLPPALTHRALPAASWSLTNVWRRSWMRTLGDRPARARTLFDVLLPGLRRCPANEPRVDSIDNYKFYVTVFSVTKHVKLTKVARQSKGIAVGQQAAKPGRESPERKAVDAAVGRTYSVPPQGGWP